MRILIGSTSAAAALLATAPAANAQERPPRPDDTAAISVYMEVVPTSGGPKALPRTTPGASASPAASVPLPTRARQALRAAPRAEAEPLERIATSPQFGAPQGPAGSAEAVAAADDEASSASSTLLRTVLDSARLVALLAGLVLLAVAAALYARRRTQPPPAA
jgi:hypothetical protein